MTKYKYGDFKQWLRRQPREVIGDRDLEACFQQWENPPKPVWTEETLIEAESYASSCWARKNFPRFVAEKEQQKAIILKKQSTKIAYRVEDFECWLEAEPSRKAGGDWTKCIAGWKTNDAETWAKYTTEWTFPIDWENKWNQVLLNWKKEVDQQQNITESLDLIIQEVKSPQAVAKPQSSKKDLTDLLDQGNSQDSGDNKLYKMTEKERNQKAKDYTGLDRVLYDKLISKVGSEQASTGSLVAGQTTMSVLNAIPIIGNFAQLASTNALMSALDNTRIRLEQRFTVNEVKDIVNAATVQQTQTLQMIGGELEKIKDEVERREQNWQNEKNEHMREIGVYENELEKKNLEIKEQKAQLEVANAKGNQLLLKNQEREEENAKLKVENEKGEVKNAELEQKVLELAKKDNEKIEQLQSQQKLLETAEQVAVRNLKEIQADYEKLEQVAQAQTHSAEQKLQTEKNKTSELMTLAAKLDNEKQIAVLEANKREKEKLLIEVQKNGLEIEKRGLEIEGDTLKNEIFGLKTQKAQLEVTITGLNGTIKVKEKELKNSQDYCREIEKEKQDLKKQKEEQHQKFRNLVDEKVKLENDNTALTNQVTNLENQNSTLQTENQDLTAKLDKSVKQSRIALLGNLAQGAIDWLPIGEKARTVAKTSIQAGAAYGLIKDLPGYTYEGLWMVVGLGLWYALLYLKRRIFGRKEINKLTELREELEDGERQLKKAQAQIKELKEKKAAKVKKAKPSPEPEPAEISNQNEEANPS